jgi:nucleotide-binding universal stress UspA family protein
MLRHVPVPVLTVSHLEAEKHAIGLVALNRILYATDLSESSSIGLRYAIELARGAGAQLTVMHVLDDGNWMLWGVAVSAFYSYCGTRPMINEEIATIFENMSRVLSFKGGDPLRRDTSFT